jgi:Na+-translocating ferredoxin:NAD+ oxidoreductase RnfC subunit
MLPDYYLEVINSSFKIACSETCDSNISLNHYIDLVKQYQQKKKELEEIEQQKKKELEELESQLL